MPTINIVDQPKIAYVYTGTSWDPIQVPDLRYEWYDTSTWYTNYGHPTTSSELDAFFDDSNSGVTFGGSGTYGTNVNWGDAGQSGAGGATGSKPAYLPADGFSWKVEGYLYAPESGTYTFGNDGDDAMDIYVNGSRVAYWYGGHGFSGSWSGGSGQTTGSISLTGGRWYKIRCRMEEGGGGDGMQAGWQKPSDGSINLIPYSNLHL